MLIPARLMNVSRASIFKAKRDVFILTEFREI